MNEDVTAQHAAMNAELQAFTQVRESLRQAIRIYANTRLMQGKPPLDPSVVVRALLGESAVCCCLWGLGSGARFETVEERFESELRKAKRLLRVEWNSLTADPGPSNN